MRKAIQTLDRFLLLLLLAFLMPIAASAQTTSFTFQGRLTDGGTPATGNYDLQFALFDSAAAGAQIGATQTVNTVAVSAGSFAVQLDFGVNAFPGATRFLEIGARPAGGGSFTILSPRQQISSTPYAIRTLSATTADTATNATKFNGLEPTSFVQSDINGNVGIGTTTPLSKLTVQTANSNYGFTQTDGNIRVGSYVGGSQSGAFGG